MDKSGLSCSHLSMKYDHGFAIDCSPEFFCNMVDIIKRKTPFHDANLTGLATMLPRYSRKHKTLLCMQSKFAVWKKYNGKWKEWIATPVPLTFTDTLKNKV